MSNDIENSSEKEKYTLEGGTKLEEVGVIKHMILETQKMIFNLKEDIAGVVEILTKENDDTPFFNDVALSYLQDSTKPNHKNRESLERKIMPKLKELTLKKLSKKVIIQFLSKELIESRERMQKRMDTLPPYAGNVENNRILQAIAVVFSYAINIGLWESQNPCQGIKKREECPRRVYITNKELQLIMNNCEEYQRNFLKLLYFTGQRPSDVVVLRWSDIVDDKLRITQKKTNHKLQIKICGAFKDFIYSLKRDSIYIIGREVGYSHLSHAIRKISRELGINFQLRDIRAKTATDAVEGLTRAQKLLGHTSAGITTTTYIREIDEYVEVVNPLDLVNEDYYTVLE